MKLEMIVPADIDESQFLQILELQAKTLGYGVMRSSGRPMDLDCALVVETSEQPELVKKYLRISVSVFELKDPVEICGEEFSGPWGSIFICSREAGHPPRLVDGVGHAD